MSIYSPSKLMNKTTHNLGSKISSIKSYMAQTHSRISKAVKGKVASSHGLRTPARNNTSVGSPSVHFRNKNITHKITAKPQFRELLRSKFNTLKGLHMSSEV